MRDLIGSTLSERYRLVARVAGGGMGEVYRGHDLLLDRPVAVKVLQPSLAADPDLVDRFRAEARAAARLAHPNIVSVHDWGSEDERTYYMVMEYVSGTDLRDVLVSRGALAPAQAVEILISVCDALAVAHATGLVHRDVKPENVLISRDGTAKVADFGIAVIVDADRTSPGGTVPGTLRYLSPEQARGQDGTPASDIWAAGALLAELLTGIPPALGSSTSDLLSRRATECMPLPSTMDPALPVELDQVVSKACALDPSERYQTAADMARELRVVAATLPEAPPVASLLDHVTGEIRLPDLEPTGHVPGRKRQRRKHSRLKLAFVAAVLLFVAAGVARGASYLLMPRMVQVPDLTGLTAEQAAERAQADGLEVQVVDRRRHPQVPEGSVIEQDPASGELEEGSRIELVVSEGLPMVRVPKVVGLALNDAMARLRTRNLEVGDLVERFSLKPKGTVLEQDPRTGRWEWETQVALVVSKGPKPVEVPSVAGLTAAKAEAVLEDTGFVVEVADEYSDDVAKGKVIFTTPAAGEVAPQGTAVQIFVSLGPEFKELKLPDVRNMSVAAARARLEGLGLRVDVQRSCGTGNTVLETEPVAGSTVRENDVIALFVC